MCQNLWDALKAMLRGEFIFVKTYLKKEERSQINHLTLFLKEQKKNQLNPIIMERREKKIRAEIRDNGKQKKKLMKLRVGFVKDQQN